MNRREHILSALNSLKHISADEAHARLVRAGIIKLNHRELTGDEKQEALFKIQFLDSYKETNNQRFVTSYYRLGNVEYLVTWFDEDECEVIEVAL